MLALSERFSNLKKVTIKASLPEKPIAIIGCPFEIRHILFRCIEIGLSSCKPHDEIEVSLVEREEGALFTVCSDATVQDSPKIRHGLQFLSLLADKYDAVLKNAPQPGQPVHIAILLTSQIHLD